MHYAGYTGERQLGAIMALVDRDLSEPYSIFTYRYFLSGWPELCVLVRGIRSSFCCSRYPGEPTPSPGHPPRPASPPLVGTIPSISHTNPFAPYSKLLPLFNLIP